jgi:hypothetical protein
VFFDPKAPDLGKPMFWRQRRAWRTGNWRGLSITAILLLLFIAVVYILILILSRAVTYLKS